MMLSVRDQFSENSFAVFRIAAAFVVHSALYHCNSDRGGFGVGSWDLRLFDKQCAFFRNGHSSVGSGCVVLLSCVFG